MRAFCIKILIFILDKLRKNVIIWDITLLCINILIGVLVFIYVYHKLSVIVKSIFNG